MDGSVVTVLWFRVSIRPSVDLVNTIETTLLSASLSNLVDHGERINTIDQGHNHNGHIWK